MLRGGVTRTTQPQTPAPIDWDNPITRGLVLLAIPVGSKFYDVISKQFTNSSGTTSYTTPKGVGKAGAVRLKTFSDRNRFANPTGADSITGAWSVFAETSPEVNASCSWIFQSSEESLGNGFSCLLDDNIVFVNSLRLGNSYLGSNSSLASSIGADSELYTHRVAWAYDRTNALFYTNGALNTSNALATDPVSNSSRRSYIFEGIGSSSAVASATVIAVWNRAITEAEYRSLYINPWQLFRPRSVWVPVSAGVGGTFSAAWAARPSRSIGAGVI